MCTRDPWHRVQATLTFSHSWCFTMWLTMPRTKTLHHLHTAAQHSTAKHCTALQFPTKPLAEARHTSTSRNTLVLLIQVAFLRWVKGIAHTEQGACHCFRGPDNWAQHSHRNATHRSLDCPVSARLTVLGFGHSNDGVHSFPHAARQTVVRLVQAIHDAHGLVGLRAPSHMGNLAGSDAVALVAAVAKPLAPT